MGIALPEETLRKYAFEALENVGDASKGQWEEYTGFIFHLRRRLNDKEHVQVGDAIDIRGTPEQEKRWRKMRRYLPEPYKNYKD